MIESVYVVETPGFLSEVLILGEEKKASSDVLQSHLPAFPESVSDYYIFRFTWGMNQWHKLINRKGLSLRKLSLYETFPKTGKYKQEKTPYLDISHQQTSFLKIKEIQLD